MTVKEFIEMYAGCNELNVSVADINSNDILESTTHYLTLCDGKNNEWKSAEVTSWEIIDGCLYLNVDK